MMDTLVTVCINIVITDVLLPVSYASDSNLTETDSGIQEIRLQLSGLVMSWADHGILSFFKEMMAEFIQNGWEQLTSHVFDSRGSTYDFLSTVKNSVNFQVVNAYSTILPSVYRSLYI
ncbi:hypothetical protein L6164_025202 [Bauhinia variegata]|uniref:Uncharacterized protein n=1 Tax=Bauhinia variegata TaxID=167791 RepID=A0ACB9M0Q6_BAUVA|nr:hypothetical protein L6164_025202 [Bauhinia variegata]